MWGLTLHNYRFLLLFLTAFILFIPFRVRIKIENVREDNYISLLLEFFIFQRIKIFKLEKTVNPSEQKKWVSSLLEKLKAFKSKKTFNIIHFFQDFKDPLQNTPFAPLFSYRFLKFAKWRKLDFFLKIGVGDPAWTAILTGCLRSLAGILSLYLLRHAGLTKERTRILIYPSFLKHELLFLFSFEFSFLLIKVLSFSAAFFTVRLLERWSQYARTSHSRFNENGYGKLKRDGGCQ